MKIRHHKVGDNSSEDIQSSFPNGAKKTSENIEVQSSFDLDEPEQIYYQNIILAYMANPDEGLAAAYLAVPKRVVNGKIEEWDNIIELFNNNYDVNDIFQNNGNDVIKPEKIKKPKVGFSKKPDAEQETEANDSEEINVSKKPNEN